MYPPHSLVLKTIPVLEPITLTEAYAQERLTPTFSGSPATPSHPEDSLLDIYIAAARQWAESVTRRAIITQTWTMTIDKFPAAGDIEIPKLELQSVTHVKYFDEDNVEQTWSDSLYQVDTSSNPGRIIPIDGEVYPSVYSRLNAVEIEFTAGYGLDGTTIPQNMKIAMLMLMGHLYQNREAVVVGTIATKVPLGSQSYIEHFVDRTETREEI